MRNIIDVIVFAINALTLCLAIIMLGFTTLDGQQTVFWATLAIINTIAFYENRPSKNA